MDKLTEKIIMGGKIRPQNSGEDTKKIQEHWDKIDWSKKKEKRE